MDIPSGQCALEPPMVASEPAEPGARADERSGAEDSPTHIECPCAYEDLTALRKIAARREGGHLDEVSDTRKGSVSALYGLPRTLKWKLIVESARASRTSSRERPS